MENTATSSSSYDTEDHLGGNMDMKQNAINLKGDIDIDEVASTLATTYEIGKGGNSISTSAVEDVRLYARKRLKQVYEKAKSDFDRKAFLYEQEDANIAEGLCNVVEDMNSTYIDQGKDGTNIKTSLKKHSKLKKEIGRAHV